jgi:hypothetical protein
VSCLDPHCELGHLPAIFADGDHPCPEYVRESLVSPFDPPEPVLLNSHSVTY